MEDHWQSLTMATFVIRLILGGEKEVRIIYITIEDDNSEAISLLECNGFDFRFNFAQFSLSIFIHLFLY